LIFDLFDPGLTGRTLLIKFMQLNPTSTAKIFFIQFCVMRDTQLFVFVFLFFETAV